MSWLDQSAAAAAAAAATATAMRPLPTSSSDASMTAAARLMQLQTAQRLAMQAHFMTREEVDLICLSGEYHRFVHHHVVALLPNFITSFSKRLF